MGLNLLIFLLILNLICRLQDARLHLDDDGDDDGCTFFTNITARKPIRWYYTIYDNESKLRYL